MSDYQRQLRKFQFYSSEPSYFSESVELKQLPNVSTPRVKRCDIKKDDVFDVSG